MLFFFVNVEYTHTHEKVQEEVARRSFWGKKIKRMSWRVDATTKTRHNDDLNEPRALVDFFYFN
jgi:hypothetical protein